MRRALEDFSERVGCFLYLSATTAPKSGLLPYSTMSSHQDIQSDSATGTRLPQNATIEAVITPRLSCHFNEPYDVVVERFRNLVPPINMPNLRSQTTPEGIADVVNQTNTPTDFCLFIEFNHGAWIRHFPVTPSHQTASDDKVLHDSASPRGLHRFIFGNPLIAITMIQHDVESGLHVPLECLFSELEDGSTKLVMLLPRGTIAGREAISSNEQLNIAVARLEEKLFSLIERLKG